MAETMRVVLRGVPYRAQRADLWTVVFTEESPIAMRPTRFMLHRSPHSLWRFEFCDGWTEATCSTIVAAYQWVLENVGTDFAQAPKGSFA